MSYDISTYIIDENGERLQCQYAGNMTWNIYPMYKAALEDAGIKIEGLNKSWSDKPITEILPQVEIIIKAMNANPARFEAMNDPDGWGDCEGALAFMKDIRLAIIKSPKEAFLDVS